MLFSCNGLEEGKKEEKVKFHIELQKQVDKHNILDNLIIAET